jgi:hypothetical protein
MSNLLNQYAEYQVLKTKLELDIEVNQKSLKSTLGAESNEILSLNASDRYAASIGATRIQNIYTLKHGQRIRYSKLIYPTIAINSESVLFNKTKEEISELSDNLVFNEKVQSNNKAIRSQLEIVNTHITSLKRVLITTTEEEIIQQLFSSLEEYTNFHSTFNFRKFTFGNKLDYIKSLYRIVINVQT